jgi:hypothetical protein
MDIDAMIAHLELHGWRPRALMDIHSITPGGIVWAGVFDGTAKIVWTNRITASGVNQSQYSQTMYDLGENVIREWIPKYVPQLYQYIMENKL